MLGEDSSISEEIRAAIGKETEPQVVGEVTLRDIRRFTRATGDENPLYLDEEYACKSKYGGIVAPPLFHETMCFAKDVSESQLMPDGLPKETDWLLPRLPTTRTVHGGSEVELFQPMRPGDVITAKKRIADVYQKQGKSGNLVFVVTETTYTNQRNELLIVDRSTEIHLD